MTILSWRDLISFVLIFIATVIIKWIKNNFTGWASQFRLQFDWKDPCRVGKVASFRISTDKSYRHDVEARELMSQLRVVVVQNNEALNIFKETTETETETILLVKFGVRKSGRVEIRVTTGRNHHIPGSPARKHFFPGHPDVDKSIFIRPSHTIYCLADSYKFLAIELRDRFENPCDLEDVDLKSFKFHCQMVDQTETPDGHSSQFYASTGRVGLRCSVAVKGIYSCHITYKDQPIPQGKFSLVAMTNSERVSLDYILGHNPSWNYHEATLLAVGPEIRRPKKIYIYVSPKQLQVKDYILKIFPIRISTFRVCNMTKIDLQFTNTAENSYTYTIRDGIQGDVTIEMEESKARVFLALYSHFLQRRIGGSEAFATKQRHFYEDLRSSLREVRISFTTVKISRDNLIESSLARTKHFRGKDWSRNFSIEFEGEEGVDAGGLRREWLDLLCKALFRNSKSKTGLFCTLGNSRLVHPNAAVNRQSNWTLKHYELGGKVVGKCLFETAYGDSHQQMVNGKFTRSFFAQILGLRPNYKHFEQDDPELFMGKIKFILESDDVESMELNFTEEEYSPSGKLLKVVDLIPNGANVRVTNDNKEDYLNAMANYRLGVRVSKELESFLKGLHSIVPEDLLNNFDENELELLMCGKSEFSVKELKEHYSAWFSISLLGQSEKRVLEWFWLAVSNMSEDEKGKLLQFTTGSSLLPHGGFASLSPKLSITFNNCYAKLPTAHTCINQICLSDNTSFEEFENCLKLAIVEGSEGFAFK